MASQKKCGKAKHFHLSEDEFKRSYEGFKTHDAKVFLQSEFKLSPLEARKVIRSVGPVKAAGDFDAKGSALDRFADDVNSTDVKNKLYPAVKSYFQAKVGATAIKKPPAPTPYRERRYGDAFWRTGNTNHEV